MCFVRWCSVIFSITWTKLTYINRDIWIIGLTLIDIGLIINAAYNLHTFWSSLYALCTHAPFKKHDFYPRLNPLSHPPKEYGTLISLILTYKTGIYRKRD